MDYKKLFKSRETRFRILKALSFVPDSMMLPLQYYIYTGKRLHLNNPQRYTEKLQLYKMYYRNPVLNICVDKYRVREYIKEKGLGHILNDLYCVTNDATKIDFSALPNQFVAKTTDGGGGNNVLICRDKSKLDIEKAKEDLNSWLGVKFINPGREWAYTGITESQIIIEKYFENKDNPEGGITDFKFFCFNGEPLFVIVDWDRFLDHKRNIFTSTWKKVDVEASDSVCSPEDFSKPINLDEMLSIARTLSADFPFVRVDLYNIEGKIYFGELTFYPWSGYVNFTPDSFDYELGKLFDCASFMK